MERRSQLGSGQKSIERHSTFANPRSELTRVTPLKPGRRKPRGRPTDEQIKAKQRIACFLARFSDTPCSGQMRLCHLIRAERLRFYNVPEDAIWDERVVANGCDRHHHAFDYARTLRIPRDQLPPGLERYARKHGMEWWLTREYGQREEQHGHHR